MYTLKPKKLLILFSSCSLLLAACYPSGEQLLSTEDNAAISEQIENIVSNNEHLEIDVPSVENISEIPKINVKIMEWNEDKLKNIFLSGKDDLEYDERNSEPFPDEKTHFYFEKDAEEDKYCLRYEPGNLLSENRRSSAFGYGTLSTFLGYAHLEDVFTDGDIGLLSKDDAIKRCTDILSSVGITNYSEPKVYAVTVDKANKFWIDEGYDELESLKESSSSYKGWTSAEDEVYLMRFPLKFGDINAAAIATNSWFTYGPVGYFVGSYVDFVVTKDEIHSLEANNIFFPEYEIGDTVKINCTSENALKIAAEHYDSKSINGVKYKIFDCNLVYVPHDRYDEKNFTLVPMWEVEAAYYSDDDVLGVRDDLFIDAETGNIIIW